MLDALLLLIAQLTGITRQYDPSLAAIAQQRSVEIVSNFSHEGKPAGAAEIIVWFTDDPVDLPARIANAWLDSGPHAALLRNPAYTRIGCGYTEVNGNHYAVCELARGSVPDTAMPKPVDWSALYAALLLAAIVVARYRFILTTYARRIYGHHLVDW